MIVLTLLRIHRCFSLVNRFMAENTNTSRCWAKKNETRLAAVMRMLEPNIDAYDSCRPHVGLGGKTMHKAIMMNMNASMIVDRFTNWDEVLRPNTSPTISVTKKRIGMKN